MRRIEPQELQRELSAGNVYLIDVRGDAAMWNNSEHIPGDLRFSMMDLETLVGRIPQDARVVLYCTCPGEATSVKAARMLEEKGYQADVLAGGIAAWSEAGLPTETLEMDASFAEAPGVDEVSVPSWARRNSATGS